MNSNKYDNISIDIGKLIKEQEKTIPVADFNAHTGQLYQFPLMLLVIVRRYFLLALYITGIWRRLIYANIVLGWFFEFRTYWVKELRLRRLELPDFYFLSGIYRQKFQQLQIEESDNFLASWQSPATIYLLFAYQYKLALHPFHAYTIAKYIKQGSRVCEYGCGLAPITQSLVTYYPNLNLHITAADIPSFMLHFLMWKYKKNPAVDVASLDPLNTTPLTHKYDVITCMTVLEHLPHPLAIVQHLHEKLKPGGYFMFDFIQSEGTGLDTTTALQERTAVLNFIREHFSIVKGTIPKEDTSVSAVIAKKKL